MLILDLKDWFKLLGYFGGIVQIITAIYIIINDLYTIYILNLLIPRTFGLDYTLYDMIGMPVVLTGLILLLGGIGTIMFLMDKLKIELDNRIHTLMITGFVGNGLGGLLVISAGILLTIYQIKYGVDWDSE